MWYVIQTKALKEREMVLKCQDILKDGEEVFTMEIEKQKRINGEWETVREVTFQKYIFVETDDPDDFIIRLRDVKGMTKMLCVSDTPRDLVKKIKEFLKLDDKKVLGENAYNYYNEHFSLDIVMGKLEIVLKTCDNK